MLRHRQYMFHKTRHTNLSENKISDHLTLETLPTEIHDHTAGYIPGSSMIHLATAIPHYKHIGAAIFRVNARHLRKEWTLGLADTLWPNPHLVYRIPVQHHAYIVTLLDLAHRSGGTLVLCPGNAKVAQTALDLAPAYMPVHLRMQTIRFEGIQSLLDVVMGLRQPVLSMEWPKNWWQSDVMKQLSKLHGAKELRVIVHYGGFATITNMTKLYVNEWEDRQHDMTRLLLDLPSLNHICLSSKKLSEKVIRNVRDFTTVLKVNDSTSRQITLHIAWVDSKVESSAHETELLLSSWSLIHVPPIGMPHTQSHQVLGMIRSPLSLTTANHWKEVTYTTANIKLQSLTKLKTR